MVKFLFLKRKFVIYYFSIIYLALFLHLYAQELHRVPIGTSSMPDSGNVRLALVHRFQHYNSRPDSGSDVFDTHINSPKSAMFLSNGKKLYINSLEGYETVVYDARTLTFLEAIKHRFTVDDGALFNGESTVFGYAYANRKNNHNVFSGKPVESCLSHQDKYLWVPYYRRSYDRHAVSPSAMAIINTETDSIVRVMPTGPLPKMVAASQDGKYLAVTHWGDNTIGIIDIAGDDVHQFKYIKHFIVGRKLTYSFDEDEEVDRDNDCGFCLRGTVFTPDSKYLLVGRMGGGGIAVFDMQTMKSLGTVFGMKENLRHIIIAGEDVVLSSNRTGFIQKANLKALMDNKLHDPGRNTQFKDWQDCYCGGTGARTIAATSDHKYIFATVNNDSKIAVIRSSNMQVIAEVRCDSYPVGMALSPEDRYLVITSQGKKNEGGNSVMIFEVSYSGN